MNRNHQPILILTWPAFGNVTNSRKSERLPGMEHIWLNSISRIWKKQNFVKTLQFVYKSTVQTSQSQTWNTNLFQSYNLIFIFLDLRAHLPIIAIPRQKVAPHVWPARCTSNQVPQPICSWRPNTCKLGNPIMHIRLKRKSLRTNKLTSDLQSVNSFMLSSDRKESQTLKSVKLP